MLSDMTLRKNDLTQMYPRMHLDKNIPARRTATNDMRLCVLEALSFHKQPVSL